MIETVSRVFTFLKIAGIQKKIKVINLLPLSMKSSELVRLLKKDGWIIIRQTGSHMIMEHPLKRGQIVCPYHGSHEIGKGLEKKIKKDAGLK